MFYINRFKFKKLNKPNHPTRQIWLIISIIMMEDNVSSKWVTAVTKVMINTKLQIRMLSHNFPKPHCFIDNSDWQMYSCGVLQTFSPSSSRRRSVVLSVFCSSSIAPDSSNSCSWSWLSSSAPSAVERDRFKGALTRPKKQHSTLSQSIQHSYNITCSLVSIDRQSDPFSLKRW